MRLNPGATTASHVLSIGLFSQRGSHNESRFQILGGERIDRLSRHGLSVAAGLVTQTLKVRIAVGPSGDDLQVQPAVRVP